MNRSAMNRSGNFALCFPVSLLVGTVWIEAERSARSETVLQRSPSFPTPGPQLAIPPLLLTDLRARGPVEGQGVGVGGRATSFLSRQDGGRRGRNDFGATASFSPGSCQLECYQIYPTFTRSYQQTVKINTCTTGHVAYVKPTVIKAISGVYTLRSKNEL